MRIKKRDTIIAISRAWSANVTYRYSFNREYVQTNTPQREDWKVRNRYCLGYIEVGESEIRHFGNFDNEWIVLDMIHKLLTEGFLNLNNYDKEYVDWEDISDERRQQIREAYNSKNNFKGFGDTYDDTLIDF